jgi:High potential iron-sulfur protein
MTTTPKVKSIATRRRLLQAAGAVSLLCFGARAANAAKASKAAVSYRDTPNGDKNCANCKVFAPPDACKTVDGAVSPNGWCKIWVKA